jgi:hypothetical protein
MKLTVFVIQGKELLRQNIFGGTSHSARDTLRNITGGVMFSFHFYTGSSWVMVSEPVGPETAKDIQLTLISHEVAFGKREFDASEEAH